MSFYTQARSELAALRAHFQMVEGRFNMLSVLFAWLARVKNTVEDVLAQFPASGPALAALVAAAITHFGFNISAGKVEAVWAAVAVIIAALTAHSLRKVAARKAAAADKK